jgi:lysophospholipase L1-like esterase
MRQLIITAVAVANVALVFSAFGSFLSEKTLEPHRFTHNSGNCFVYEAALFTPSDTMDSAASALNLFEDDKLLEPGHSQHEAIRQAGQGRFSHWGNEIYMSSSDNSDPRTNARVYKITYPIRPSSSVVAIALLLSAMALPFAARTTEGRIRIYKRYYFPLLAIIMSTVVIIIPIEMFLRTDYSKEHVFGALQKLPPKLRPTLNDKGYRDTKHNINKSSGSVRILILGDSLTFGSGVADDEIYPRLLQRLAGPNVEVISLAQNGWGTADELAALRRDGLVYSPDIVLVGVVTNDPSPPITEDMGQSPPWVVFQNISRKMMLFRLIDFRLNLVAESRAWKYSYSAWEDDIYDPNKRYRAKWEKAVNELSQELGSRGIAPYAFLLVGPTQANELSAWKFKILNEVFVKAGFKTYNLLQPYIETFQGVDPTTLFALPDDSHPGPKVHEFYANELWKVIKPETIRK